MLSFFLAVALHQHPGVLALDQVIVANHEYVGHLPDGGNVKLLEVDVQDGAHLSVAWPKDKQGQMVTDIKPLPNRPSGRVVWFVYQIPPDRKMPMSRWVLDPAVQNLLIKIDWGGGKFAEALSFPEGASSATLDLGVPFGFEKTYRSWPISTRVRKDAAWISESSTPDDAVVGVDISLDPGASEFIGFARTDDGVLQVGKVAHWSTDSHGRLKNDGPQYFAFAGVSKSKIVGFSLSIRPIAYVEFRDVPLTP